MSILAEQNLATSRQVFKILNRFMVTLFRLGLGGWVNAWPEVSGKIMVIKHIGRRSGKDYCTPVNYASVNGEIYCVAGFGQIADWYRNLIANPRVEVWLPEGWWACEAIELPNNLENLPILREVVIASGFAGPLFGVDGRKMSDEELSSTTKDYRILHIKRMAARTGSGGPNDLAWIWPVATFILLPLALRGRRKK